MEFNTEFEKELVIKASALGKTIVLPEAGYSKIVFDAGILCATKGIANIIFLVKSDTDLQKFNYTPTNNIKVININNSELFPVLSSALVIKRASKGLTEQQANQLLKNELYFGTMMVELGFADGMVSGAENTTADSLRPALQIIKGKTPDSIISSCFVMVSENKQFGEDGIFVIADCAINENPTREQIVSITYDTVKSARVLANISPKVSLLSFSTLGSADGADPQKMRNAANDIKAHNPDFVIEGEMQLDASIVPAVATKKAPNGNIKGNANVLIFPNLSCGNISYKLMQRFGGFTAIGPICQGFKKPVNDVSRGANAIDICLTIAITCLQAE